MAVRTAIWKVGEQPELLVEGSLSKEQLLEDMIVAAPAIISDEWMLIGRQEDTGFGGRVDLLAVAPDGSLVLIELKRNRTPREVVAQALDYAGWVESLRSDEIAGIYGRYAPGRSFFQDLRARFGQDFDEQSLNQSHQVIIVAASLDDSTERIVAYLSKREIPINVLCFQVFTHGIGQLLCRTWLLDPVHTQLNTTSVTEGSNEPWNGEFYCNFGAGPNRSWEEAVRFGFVSAGGGSFYTRTLQLLSPGDRIWVKAPGRGFVGVARVTGRAQPASTFAIKTPSGDTAALQVLTGGTYHRQFLDDRERCEYFVPVHWLDAVSLENAVQEIGLFGNQNTVCKPTAPKWRSTVDRLKKEFRHFDDTHSTSTNGTPHANVRDPPSATANSGGAPMSATG
jgi:Endonuclease NucS